MRSALVLPAVCALLVGCASAQPEPLRPERLEAFSEVLGEAVSSGVVPGVVALVTTPDGVVYHQAFGVLDPAEDLAMRPDAIFEIASMTKPITSLGVMMLVEEGLIALDDPASAYLPELAGREVLVRVDTLNGTIETRPATREVTVRDLLLHTSGIGYAFSNHDLLAVARHTSIPDRMAPLVHDPGTRWTYGRGTAHLGWIIENVSGLPLETFLQQRILQPLGMDDTSFGLPREKAHRLAAKFDRTDGALVPNPRPESRESAGRGDAGLLSTAADYARFIQLMLGRGERDGVRVISEATFEEMTRNHLADLGLTVVEQPSALPTWSKAFPLGAGRDGFSLGYQVASDAPDGRSDGSLSWAGLFNTHFWIDPDAEIGVVLLFQLLPFNDEHVVETLRAAERALYY